VTIPGNVARSAAALVQHASRLGSPHGARGDPNCWRSDGIGYAIPKTMAPTPTPPSHVYGGCVPTLRVDGFSAAQNMKPSMLSAAGSIQDCMADAQARAGRAALLHSSSNRARAASS
jgi:hypothetical protein